MGNKEEATHMQNGSILTNTNAAASTSTNDSCNAARLPDDLTEPQMCKRRKHRRGRKKSRMSIQGDGSCSDSIDGDEVDRATLMENTTPRLPAQRSHTRCPILRPTQRPMAPENSTQFIMDDHDNSDMFWNFELDAPSHANVSATPAREDECFWSSYSDQCFENEYWDVRGEDLIHWSMDKLLQGVVQQERRVLKLENYLRRSDPNNLLAYLQSSLLTLQEENKALKEETAMWQAGNAGVLSDEEDLGFMDGHGDGDAASHK